MKIQFVRDVELEIIVDEFENSTTKKWKAGEIEDVKIIENKVDTVDIQFKDGTIAYDVFNDCFKIKDNMQNTYIFEIIHNGNYSHGIHPYNNTITIKIKNDLVDTVEFKKYMKEKLEEWFDGANILTTEKLENFEQNKF